MIAPWVWGADIPAVGESYTLFAKKRIERIRAAKEDPDRVESEYKKMEEGILLFHRHEIEAQFEKQIEARVLSWLKYVCLHPKYRTYQHKIHVVHGSLSLLRVKQDLPSGLNGLLNCVLSPLYRMEAVQFDPEGKRGQQVEARIRRVLCEWMDAVMKKFCEKHPEIIIHTRAKWEGAFSHTWEDGEFIPSGEERYFLEFAFAPEFQSIISGGRSPLSS